MSNTTINTSKFSFVWGGTPARGFADGDAVVAEWANDVVAPYSGTRGEGALVNGADDTGQITVRLQSNSESIATYTEMFERVLRGETCAPDFIYKKIDGERTIAITGTCNLSKHPSESSSRDMPVVELVFLSADMTKERT